MSGCLRCPCILENTFYKCTCSVGVPSPLFIEVLAYSSPDHSTFASCIMYLHLISNMRDPVIFCKLNFLCCYLTATLKANINIWAVLFTCILSFWLIHMTVFLNWLSNPFLLKSLCLYVLAAKVQHMSVIFMHFKSCGVTHSKL